MKCMFDKCFDAISYASENRTFGVYYSEKQNPDLNIHIHDCCEVLVCISGGMSFLINDKVYDVNDGDIFIINQFEAHKITFAPEKCFRRFVMQVHPQFLYSQSTVKTNLSYCFYARGNGISNKISLDDESKKKLLDLFGKLSKESSFGDDIIKTNIATEILVLINSAFIEHSESQEIGIDNDAIKKAIDHINNNFNTDLSLEKIAANSYVSVNQLCRLFNKYCGTTVAKYIVSKRITEAKKLLASGKSVTETALLCGFEDYSNFIRVFKKHVGITPGKYHGI